VDVQKKLDEIVTVVSGARSMPMSASCVVNRAELLSLLDGLRAVLPDSLAQAQELIGDRDHMVERARLEAERIIGAAHAERGSLVSDTEVARRSRNEADRILTEARQEAEEVRAEADDYVDSKLANFEVVLTKTLGSVGRGREKLLGTGTRLDEQGHVEPEEDDAPERSHDPEQLRRDADSYVDAKLGAFEAVLAKTLDAVGRGRQKLHGRIASDDLGALSLNDDGTSPQPTSDADYLAGLADLSDTPAQQSRAVPDQQSYGQQQDTYRATAYQQAPYGGYQQQYAQPQQAADPYGYQQAADPYAAGYPQQSAPAYDPNHGHQNQHGHQEHQEHQNQHGQQEHQGYAQPQARTLDETSLFDTTMITAEQLRRHEQGR
jgi:cell division septum initiation protein DivIVA